MEADIIRVANLFVERTGDHRGYYYRDDILRGIGRLGSEAKDGAYLYLDNFRRGVEHVGRWRKNGAAGLWERLPVAGDRAVDLAGIGDILIGSDAAGKPSNGSSGREDVPSIRVEDRCPSQKRYPASFGADSGQVVPA